MRLALAIALVLATAYAPHAEPHRRIVTRGDVTIEYTDEGTGPAIAAIASLGRGSEDFADLSRRLAQRGFRVIAPEPRGIGRSAGPMADLTLHDYAADVAAVIEQAGAAPAVVLGHAYGNTVARTLATDRPDLVRGVILVAASGRAPMDAEAREGIARSSDLSLPAAERAHFLAQAYFAAGHDASAWMGGWFPAVQAAEMRAYARSKPDDYLAAGGTVPILDLQGAEDVIIPHRLSLDLQRELGPRVTVVVLPDAGHALLPEQPEAAVNAIAGWLATIPVR